MEFIEKGILVYRAHKHTCLTHENYSLSESPLKGPTLCMYGRVCYALPRSVEVEPCDVWVHTCCKVWSEHDWETVFIKEWMRASGHRYASSSWISEIKYADMAWFPVKHVSAFGDTCIRKYGYGKNSNNDLKVGFILCDRSMMQK
jgi:hypothetical protein